MALNRSDIRHQLVHAFPGLSAEDPDLSRIFDRAQLVKLDRERFVFRSGDLCDAFLILVDGSVRVQLTSAGGREVTLYRIGPGGSCILTTSCLLSHENYPAEAVAESDVTAVAIPNSVFQEALDHSRAFRDFVFDGFSKRLTSVIQRIEEVALTPIDTRLAEALLKIDGDGSEQVTHQQLAVELGTAREVVSRHLKKFEREGLVELGRGRIRVLDPDQLKRAANKNLCD